jgi:predicted negative regulator of RcsB-dependent stress response
MLPLWVWPAVAIAVILAYLPALRGPFLFDDLTIQALRAKTFEWHVYSTGIRPLFYISLLFDRTVLGFGDDAFGYHVVNLVLHLANGLLLFLVLRRWTGTIGGVEDASREWLAAAGAALFLLHPMQTEAVSYIASRSEALSVFFAYGALVLFAGREEEGVSWPRAAGILALFLLAAATKEHVFAAVGVMLLADWYWRSEFSLRAMARDWRLFGPMIAGGLAAAFYLWGILKGNLTAGLSAQGTTPLQYFATQCKVIWHYVRLIALPFGQNIDHAMPLSRPFGDAASVLGAVMLIATAAAAFVMRKKAPLASFGWLAFLILLTPTSSFVPIADAMAERRVYLPFVGIALIAAQVLLRIQPAKRAMFAAAGVAALCLGLTWQRNQVYTSAEAMWSDSAAKNPANGRAQFQYAHALYALGRCQESSEHYALAAKNGVTDYTLYLDWSLALDCSGKTGEALTLLLGVPGNETESHLRATIGMFHAKRGENEKALAAIDQAIAIDGAFDMAHAYRGNVLLATGKREEAAVSFQRALALNPENPVARQGLAAAGR